MLILTIVEAYICIYNINIGIVAVRNIIDEITRRENKIMKKLSFVLAVCLLASCFTLFASAADDFDVVIIDGVPCVKDEIILFTNVFYDPDDYTDAEGSEFLGICIVKLEALFPCETDEELKAWQEKVGDLYSYCVTIDGKIPLKEAIKVLSEQETVLEADINGIIYLDDELDTYTASESPINESNVDEIKVSDSFVSSVFELTFEEELDVSQFGGEEKGYLFGVGIESIEKAEGKDDFTYTVTVDGEIKVPIVKLVFESADGISALKAFSTYGSGDVNKDRAVDKFDYILIKRLCLGTFRGTITQLGASDINTDGTVDKFDYILAKRQVFGTYTISNEIIIP